MQNVLQQHKYKLILIVVSVVTLIAVGATLVRLTPSQTASRNTTPASQEEIRPAAEPHYSYEGQEGVNALLLLERYYQITQDEAGLVTSINGREAEADKREFWAFYVNGTSSPVGPQQYITKEGDRIEWKIETY